MIPMKLAFPTYDTGFNGPLCEHFGHSEKFAIVDFDEQTHAITNVTEIPNLPHEAGGCMNPVLQLKSQGVQGIIILGIGGRPLQGFLSQGISVFQGISGSVRANFEAYIDGKLASTAISSCQQHHH
jgi:predicted Fe-Mo cluster-binding NifX family protein